MSDLTDVLRMKDERIRELEEEIALLRMVMRDGDNQRLRSMQAWRVMEAHLEAAEGVCEAALRLHDGKPKHDNELSVSAALAAWQAVKEVTP